MPASGFTENSDGVFVDTNAAFNNSNDFESWTWKEIRAAILGGASMPPSGDGPARVAGLIDPQTLFTASVVFGRAQANLEQLAAQISKAAGSVAGEGSGWQGQGAASLQNAMDNFALKMRAKGVSPFFTLGCTYLIDQGPERHPEKVIEGIFLVHWLAWSSTCSDSRLR
ncbi:hypothetical protein LWC34_31490 [Kibdelosporangium philippinense]|uniref:Uncharacterized protein n=1 Tax=Kibdelosporangium philippinense TaxID=211113 RepID=A0ABS8ZHM7_9PSEU|nr:hypothetical protein [Kibdelosporangium philippinense]MCE7007311.1 hypothetical protein [Kibdelosporangium philippinense]